MSEIDKINEKINDNRLLVELLMVVAKLIITHGIPALLSLLRGLADSRITPERIAAAALTKKPIEFFPCLEDEKPAPPDCEAPDCKTPV